MTVVDSSVWIDWFNGTPTPAADRLDTLIDRDRIVVGDLVLAEVLRGFASERDFARAQAALDAFECLPMAGRAAAIDAAGHHRALRRRGVTVRGTVDLLIASACLRHDLPLLFSDRDFLPFVRHLGLRDALAPRNS